jgi:quinol monooxygenase YgiN
MSLVIHAEIHGLAGRAQELRDLLAQHATALAAAEGCEGARALTPLDADVGEHVLDALWRDEASLRAHYATPQFTHYVSRIGELLARPSDVTIHYVERTVRPEADLSLDPTRQG